MSDFSVEILDKGLMSNSPFTPADLLEWQLNTFSTGEGGPRECSITGYGTVMDLFEMLEALRCQVRVYDSEGFVAWYGMVEEVQVRIDSIEVSVSLRYMYNKIAVEFNNIVPGSSALGDNVLTDWATEQDSIDEYGTKELKMQMNDATLTQAEGLRDRMLEDRKFPVADWYYSGSQASMSCTLLCVGYRQTLDWEYYEYLDGYVAYPDSGEGVQALGQNSGNQGLAQSFQLAGTLEWSTVAVRVKVRKQGSPTDNLRLDLCSDSSGDPGTSLAYSEVAGTGLPTDYNWLEFDLSARVPLSQATTYWLKLTRSGSTDSDNYYMIDVNQELGYTDGVLRIYDGSDWDPRDPDADLMFEVLGEMETTEQLELMANEAQFIGDIEVLTDSGMYGCPYRDGSYTILSDMTDLIKAGTSNYRKIWTWIDIDRSLTIDEEPEKPSYDVLKYFLTSKGQLLTSDEAVVPIWRAPVGDWAAIDVVPLNVDTSFIADPRMVFIEGFDYDNRSSRGRLWIRGIPTPYNTSLRLTEDK